MKFRFATLLAVTLAITASAQETAATFDWKTPQQSNHDAFSGTVVTTNGKSILQITSPNAGLTMRLLTVTNPPVTKKLYAITGQIKYENVSGDGYLEMWNYFPPSQAGAAEEKFPSRTLAQYGAMKKIRGTSDWRDFIMPFNSEGASAPPTRLEVNIVLPGKGNVSITPLKLVMYEPNQIAALVRGGWTNGIGPWLGLIVGVLTGCFGVVLGWLAKNGRARTFVMVGLRAISLIGILLIVDGLLLMRSEPSALWLPMLIFGAILASTHFRIPAIRRRYQELQQPL